MDRKRQSILKPEGRLPLQEMALPDFLDEDTTTTITKSRRVSFGANFVKEFIVGSAVSAEFFSEYEQAVSSSDSSNQNTSRSGFLDLSSSTHLQSDVLNSSAKHSIEDDFLPIRKKLCSENINNENHDRMNEKNWEFNIANDSNTFINSRNNAAGKLESNKSVKPNKKQCPLNDSTIITERSLQNKKSNAELNNSKICDSSDKKGKHAKFSSTICFSADSPSADMQFTEGCINLAKSILDKKNKEMTVYIQAKPKDNDKRDNNGTIHFEASDVEMSITKCVSNDSDDSCFDNIPGDTSNFLDDSQEDTEYVPLHMHQLDNILNDSTDSPEGAELKHSLFSPKKSLSEMLSDSLTNSSFGNASLEKDNNEECDMELVTCATLKIETFNESNLDDEDKANQIDKRMEHNTELVSCDPLNIETHEENNESNLDDENKENVNNPEDCDMELESCDSLKVAISSDCEFDEGREDMNVECTPSEIESVDCELFEEQGKESGIDPIEKDPLQISLNSEGSVSSMEDPVFPNESKLDCLVKDEDDFENINKVEQIFVGTPEKSIIHNNSDMELSCINDVNGKDDLSHISDTDENKKVETITDNVPVSTDSYVLEKKYYSEKQNISEQKPVDKSQGSPFPDSSLEDANEGGCATLQNNSYSEKCFVEDGSQNCMSQTDTSTSFVEGTNTETRRDDIVPDDKALVEDEEMTTKKDSSNITVAENTNSESQNIELMEHDDVNDCLDLTHISATEDSNKVDCNVADDSERIDTSGTNKTITEEINNISQSLSAVETNKTDCAMTDITNTLVANKSCNEETSTIFHVSSAEDTNKTDCTITNNSEQSDTLVANKSLAEETSNEHGPSVEDGNKDVSAVCENAFMPEQIFNKEEQKTGESFSLTEDESKRQVSIISENDMSVVEHSFSTHTKRDVSDFVLRSPEQNYLGDSIFDTTNQTINSNDESSSDPVLLWDKKIVLMLTEQSQEQNCYWKIENIPCSEETKFWSFSFPIGSSSAVATFRIEPPEKSPEASFSIITEKTISLRPFTEFQSEKCRKSTAFAFAKLRHRFQQECLGLDNVHKMPLFLDNLNLYLRKINSVTSQILRILKEYPGSRLKESTLSFRLYSFPMMFSCSVLVDVSDPLKFSDNAITIIKHFGNFNEVSIQSTFRDCLKSDQVLVEFVRALVQLVISKEREIGRVTNRAFIRLIS